jgi:hypothetical protein
MITRSLKTNEKSEDFTKEIKAIKQNQMEICTIIENF